LYLRLYNNYANLERKFYITNYNIITVWRKSVKSVEEARSPLHQEVIPISQRNKQGF